MPLYWLNDPQNVLFHSYPQDKDWTSSIGAPSYDISVPVGENPIIQDTRLAELHAKSIIKRIRIDLPIEKQAVLMVNHGIFPHNQAFDPKINDTTLLVQNIEDALRRALPSLTPDFIRGAYFGIPEVLEGKSPQLTRQMRG